VLDFSIPSLIRKSIQQCRGHIPNALEIGGKAGVQIRVISERHDTGMR
jgi:hypothetical protein